MDDPDVMRQSLIEEHGWMVMHVFSGEDGQPGFGYTIGVWKTFRQPELLIVGLGKTDIHTLCNRYGQAVRDGERFRAGERLADWIETGDMLLVEVGEQWKSYFMGKAFDDFGPGFPALQAVWPAEGAYPWDGAWPEKLRGAQFVLTATPGPPSG